MRTSSAKLALADGQDGFTIVEVMVAALVLAVGVVALVGSFDPARRLGTSAELHQVASARAEAELNRITSLPFEKIAMKETPTTNTGATKADPTYFISNSSCSSNGPAASASPCYQWDWNNSSSVEALYVESTKGKVKESQTWTTTISTSNGATRLTGTTYSFVTWANDSSCTASACGKSNDDKRAIVAVTIPGMSAPVELSSLITNPEGEYDPVKQSGVTCTNQGVTVPCIG